MCTLIVHTPNWQPQAVTPLFAILALQIAYSSDRSRKLKASPVSPHFHIIKLEDFIHRPNDLTAKHFKFQYTVQRIDDESIPHPTTERRKHGTVPHTVSMKNRPAVRKVCVSSPCRLVFIQSCDDFMTRAKQQSPQKTPCPVAKSL